MSDHQADYPIASTCRLLGVSAVLRLVTAAAISDDAIFSR